MSYPIFILLALVGIALMVWAKRNPKWQGQDSYDALAPFLLGLACLAIALLGTAVVWLQRLLDRMS